MRENIIVFLCLMATLYSDEQALIATIQHTKIAQRIERVAIIGHKLHTHTHSYIHNAFARTFTFLGFQVYWLDAKDDYFPVDLPGTLFITEGQVDAEMPVRLDCFYILHNCTSPRYKPLFEKKRAMKLQVYTHGIRERAVVEVEPYVFFDVSDQTMYMPWATDLFPHEIDAIKAEPPVKKNMHFYWIGTIGEGLYGNKPEISEFLRACRQNKITFVYIDRASIEQNKTYIQHSCIAPAIQGKWQLEHGYIPCRIFKNISYGQLGITNSATVADLFGKYVVYNPDCYQLFYDARYRLEHMQREDLFEAMDFVRDHHTYLNRIQRIFEFCDLVFNFD